MILIFGGTTEGRKAAAALEEAGKTFYYSTRGNGQEIDLVHGIRTTGEMDADAIVDFCNKKGVALIIDAAHPFAKNLHKNIVEAARRIALPVIRYERQYPPHDNDLVWCKDYADAAEQMEMHGVERLLALTGVQTIGSLKSFWLRHHTWFRILHRDSSVEMAQRHGFPKENLTFYDDEPTAEMIKKLQPDAIITKESGTSGGFTEKVEAARKAGISVFVVQRPTIDAEQVNLVKVNGPHGMRLKTQEILPDFYELKTGITTGTCATAAAVAALTRQNVVSVRIPDGEDIEVRISALGKNSATVTKTAGDDPDITDGLDIVAKVETYPADNEQKGERQNGTRQSYIDIEGGEGVGTVTLPGLGLPIGSAAINETPQQMIRRNVLPLLPKGMSATVTISVPQGRETGTRTFNPRIGVVGGISIIGTSGIVKPFSSEAWINSIRKEMSVGLQASKAESSKQEIQIVINSGAKSEHFMRKLYPKLPEQAFIHYGNFIGETITIAKELGVTKLAMGVMIGKAVKLAEGRLDTHSHKTTMNIAFVQEMLNESGVKKDIGGINMARQLWSILTPEEMQRLEKTIIEHCHEHCDPLLPDGKIDITLISENITK
ncbi:cobalt-precorrin-5B (C(1))-methyltransferase CbiD [Prevotella sp. OH937_COT-195]|uniref:cobalt-precorrin-5B (C(1))-methyltransferase CbiD n=1 Tax=Prevotella sp. OH937_COT-195 TaxID=2491051 RepID=UPI000F64F5D2|nr:cobalt-precorrin-5B (C(1))-methyltransferase CbiD [Prevotella sp. OH937_COT-195]RRD00282.1 precorrin-6x reductase [Prevotella sp. OH937_COT-195]